MRGEDWVWCGGDDSGAGAGSGGLDGGDVDAEGLWGLCDDWVSGGERGSGEEV